MQSIRSRIEKLAITIVACALFLQPLAGEARSSVGHLVVAPDPSYVEFELQSAHDVIAASATMTRATLDAGRLERPAARAYVAFPITDPKTGKPVPRTATIVLRSGKSVNAGAYWDRVNDLEQRANSVGATLRETKPLITGRIRVSSTLTSGVTHAPQLSKSQITADRSTLESLSERDASLADYPKSVAPPPAGTAAITAGALTAKLNMSSNASGPPLPCLNAPHDTIATKVLSPGFASTLAPAVAPTKAPIAGGVLTTKSNLPNSAVHVAAPTGGSPPASGGFVEHTTMAAGALSITNAATMAEELALEEEKCPIDSLEIPHSYRHADLGPYVGKLPDSPINVTIGDPNSAELAVTGDVSVGSDTSASGAPAPTITGFVSAKGYLLGDEADLLDATARAGSHQSSIDLKVVGQSVVNKAFGPGETTQSGEQSYTFLNYNLSVPIIPTIDVDVNATLTGKVGADYDVVISKSALQNSASFDAHGQIDGQFSGGIDIDAVIVDVSGGVAGTMKFASFDIPAAGGVGLVMIDRTIGGKKDHDPRHIRDCQLNFTYMAQVASNLTAMSGEIHAFAKECVDYFVGESCSEQDVELVHFSTGAISPSAGFGWQSAAFGPHYTDGPSYGIPLRSDERFSADDRSTAVPQACGDFPIQYAD